MQEGLRKVWIVSARQLISRSENSSKSKNLSRNFLPFRVNQSGVMPIIFASSILILPVQISQFIGSEKVKEMLLLISPVSPNQTLYLSIYFCCIIIFNLFYGSVILNPSDISQNLKKMASTVVGVRPGLETENFLKKTIQALNLVGSVFLILISVIPIIAQSITKLSLLNGLASTSLIIIVGTSVEIIKQVRTYEISQSYEEMS